MLEALSEAEKLAMVRGYLGCRDNGFLTKKRKPRSITQPDPAAQASEGLVKQDFTATSPMKSGSPDINEIACKNGKLYLSAVLDCFDDAVVGHSMDNNRKTPLCTAALHDAVFLCTN